MDPIELSEPRAEVLVREWTRALFGALVKMGLRHAVISPGSRNAPLIFGALEQRELICHSVLDERSAGFFALGLARFTRVPVALVCTSGSAVAHYLPAVIEAHQSGVPLLILSADRPSALQSCGAAQTIDQTSILGRFAAQLSGWDEPSSTPLALEHWVRKIGQAYRLADGPSPGPVHINVPLDKPLEVLAPVTPVEQALAQRVDHLLATQTQLTRVRLAPTPADLAAFYDSFKTGGAHHLLSVGPVEPETARVIQRFAEHTRWPLVSELPQLAQGCSPDVFSGAWMAKPSSETLRILHFGPPFSSARWARLVSDVRVEQWIVSGPRYLDPSGRARRLLQGDIEWIVDALCQLPAPSFPSANLPWPAVTSPQAALDATRHLIGDDRMGEPHAMACALGALDADAQLLLANSLSVRLAAWLQIPMARHNDVYTSRGANGIDGWIAQACGVSAASGKKTLLVVGDVAAAHDLSSLSLGRALNTPLAILVLDNEGGRIFEHLPGARLWADHPGSAEYFLTPPRVDWMAAAATYGLHAEVCLQTQALEHAIRAAWERRGASLIVARVDPTVTHHFLRALHAEPS